MVTMSRFVYCNVVTARGAKRLVFVFCLNGIDNPCMMYYVHEHVYKHLLVLPMFTPLAGKSKVWVLRLCICGHGLYKYHIVLIE